MLDSDRIVSPKSFIFLKHQLLCLENAQKLGLRRRPPEAQVPVDHVEEHEHGGEDDDAGVVDLGQAGLLRLWLVRIHTLSS